MKKETSWCNVYVLGNPLVEEDALPLRVLPRLRETFPTLHFIEIDPTENFPEEEHLIIIDTILNAPRVVVWTDVDAIQSSPSYSLHDFDLGMTLKIMQKMGKLQRATIFGVPPVQNENENQLLEELKQTMSNLLSESASHN